MSLSNMEENWEEARSKVIKYRGALERIANEAVMYMDEDRKIKGDLVGKLFFIECLARDTLEET